MTRSTYPVVVACVLFGLASREKQQSSPSAKSLAARIAIQRLEPKFTVQGRKFNVQPEGHPALTIFGADIPPASVLLWNGCPLKFNGGGSRGWATAGVPAGLYATPCIAKLVLRGLDGVTISNTIDFTVYAETGPASDIAELYSPSALAGRGFNLQPGGGSALGVRGAGFLPGARIFFGGKRTKTSFASTTNLTAAIPSTLASRAGSLQVWVVNRDGKAARRLAFQIA